MTAERQQLVPHDSANSLQEKWLDFFLGCVREVAPYFRIGRPKTDYVPIQTENGRRNPISVWQEQTGVRISFTLDENSDFEAQLRNAGLECEYHVVSKHLVTFTSQAPDGYIAEILKVLAIASAKRALPGLSYKPKEKLRFDSPRYGVSI